MSALPAMAVPGPDRDAEAIARTVLYASLFDYPLTLAQLRESLIESAQTEADVLATYRRSAWLRGTVEYAEGFFYPTGRGDLIATRRTRERFSVTFLERHSHLLRAVCALPFVRMVAISGSLAHLNLDETGDLDLFVITRGPRVWSVTVAIVVLARLLRCRRTVCANFAIADTRLAIGQQDLFTANQIIHLKPIAGVKVYAEFMAANPFVTGYYPNFTPRRDPRFPAAATPGVIKRAFERLLDWPSLGIETLCRLAYQWHLRRRSSSWRSPEQVALDPDCVKLHTRSHREPVLARFNAAVVEMLGCGFTHAR